MYTKDMKLVDVTNWKERSAREKLYSFRQLESCWKKHRRTEGGDMCSRIVDPISFEINGSVDDYVNAFHFLLQHEYTYELAVRKPRKEEEKSEIPENIGNEIEIPEKEKGWAFVKITPHEVKNFSTFLDKYGEHIKSMARIAYEDKVKDNFLRIKFRRWDEESRSHKGGPAKIEFREYKGRLIGYQCIIPSSLENLFTLTKQKKARKYSNNHGMWVPDDFGQIPNPNDDEKPPEGEDPLRWVLRGIK